MNGDVIHPIEFTGKRFLISMGFAVISYFIKYPKAWFLQENTHDGFEGCSRCPLDIYMMKNKFLE